MSTSKSKREIEAEVSSHELATELEAMAFALRNVDPFWLSDNRRCLFSIYIPAWWVKEEQALEVVQGFIAAFGKPIVRKVDYDNKMVELAWPHLDKAKNVSLRTTASIFFTEEEVVLPRTVTKRVLKDAFKGRITVVDEDTNEGESEANDE